MLGKNGEACVLDDRVPDGAEFEVMGALCEKFISVDPGQKTGNVAQLRKIDYSFVDLDFKTAHKLALEDSVVNFPGSMLLGSQGLGGIFLAEDGVEAGEKFGCKRVDDIFHLVVALVEPQQKVVVLGRQVGIDEIADVARTSLQFDILCYLGKSVDVAVAPLEFPGGVQITKFLLKFL